MFCDYFQAVKSDAVFYFLIVSVFTIIYLCFHVHCVNCRYIRVFGMHFIGYVNCNESFVES